MQIFKLRRRLHHVTCLSYKRVTPDLFECITQFFDSDHVSCLCQHLWSHQLHEVFKVHFTSTCRTNNEIYIYFKEIYDVKMGSWAKNGSQPLLQFLWNFF